MDLTLTKEENKQGLQKPKEYEDPELAGITKGANGEEIVDVDYAPIAPEMPTKVAEEKKFGGNQSKKAKRRKGLKSKRHFTKELRTSMQNYDSTKAEKGKDVTTYGKLSVLDQKYLHSDFIRLWQKDELLRSVDFEERVEHTEKFQAIMDQMRAYAEMDVTGVTKENAKGEDADQQIMAEGEQLNKLLGMLDEWRGTSEGDDEIHERERGLCEAYYQRLFPLTQGNLDMTKKKGQHIDRTKAELVQIAGKNQTYNLAMKDVSQMPLFSHEPSINDVVQISVADCYLASSLSNLAENDPEAVKNMIRDNGDGTATVRFYKVEKNKKDGEDKNQDPKSKKPSEYSFSPVYVSVKKQIPQTQLTGGALWVKMVEMAYAASGLAINDEQDALQPKNSTDKINYSDIEDGNTGFFLMQLTGKPMENMKFMTAANKMGDSLLEVIAGKAEEAKKAAKEKGTYDKTEAALSGIAPSQEATHEDVAPILKNIDFGWIANRLFQSETLEVARNGRGFNEQAIDFSAPELAEAVVATARTWLINIVYENAEKQKDENGKDIGYKRIASKMELANAANGVKNNVLPNNVPLITDVLKKTYKDTADFARAIDKLKNNFKTALFEMVVKSNKFANDDRSRLGFGKMDEGGKPEQTVKQIRQWREDGKLVGAASNPTSWFGTLEQRAKAAVKKTGEHTMDGLASGHSYAVLGVQTRGSRNYVMVRNPWGKGTREYVLNDAKKIEDRGVEDFSTCGIFLVEINDFLMNFNELFAA